MYSLEISSHDFATIWYFSSPGCPEIWYFLPRLTCAGGIVKELSVFISFSSHRIPEVNTFCVISSTFQVRTSLFCRNALQC